MIALLVLMCWLNPPWYCWVALGISLMLRAFPEEG